MKNPSLCFLVKIFTLLTFLHSVTVFAMDPQEAKGIIGDIEQFCSDEVHQTASSRLQKENEETSSAWASSSAHSSADYLTKASEVEELGITTLATGYRGAASLLQDAADQYQLAALAHAQGERVEGEYRRSSGKSLQATATYKAKAYEVEEAGERTLSMDYKELATISQRAADHFQRAAEAQAEGKVTEAEHWNLSGKSRQSQANYQEKAIEAREIAETTLAVSYKEAAAISREASESHAQSVQIRGEGKENAGISWGLEGISLQARADYQIKAYEAQEAGKTTLAADYREIAAISQYAAERFKRSAQAYTESTLGYVGLKKQQGDSLRSEGCSLQTKAEYQVKSIDAQEAGKTVLAVACREAASVSQRAADQQDLAHGKFIIEKKDEGLAWHCLGRSLQAVANYQAKASEAEEEGKTILSIAYREAATTSQSAADRYRLSAQVYADGKESEGICWFFEGESFQAIADYQAKASQAEATGVTELAVTYREAIIMLQDAAEQYQKLLQTVVTGKIWDKSIFYWIGRSLQWQTDYKVKANKAQHAGKVMLADEYREAAGISKKVAAYCQRATQIIAEGKKDEESSLTQVSQYFQSAADHKAEAAEKREEIESEKSVIKKDNRVLHSKPISNSQKFDHSIKSKALLVFCEKWLAETGLATEYPQIISDYVMDVVKGGADYELVRAFEEYRNHVIKAHELGDDPLALGWIQVAEGIQQAIKDSIQQAEALKNKNKKLSNDWKNTVQVMQEIAEYRNQYIEASLVSQTPEIKGEQKKIIEGLQSAADYLRKAAEARASKNEQGYKHFKEVANFMKESVMKSEKSVKILEKLVDVGIEKYPEVSISWRKTFHQYQESAKYYCKAGEATSRFNTICYDRYKKAADSAEYSAQLLEGASVALEKAIQAKEANQEELAVLWFRTARQYEASVEYYREEVNAEASGNTIDYNRLCKARYPAKASAQQFREASITFEKAIQAREASQEEVAALWFEATKKNQESAEYYHKAVEAKLREDAVDGSQWENLAASTRSSADALWTQTKRAEEELKLANKNRKK